MTTSRYPLTEALGVKVREEKTMAMSGVVTYFGHYGPIGNGGTSVKTIYVVDADDVEAALAKAPAVTANKDDRGWFAFENNPGQIDTHTARLVCLQLIVRDTPESLLRELVDYHAHGGARGCVPTEDYVDRARRLLGGDK